MSYKYIFTKGRPIESMTELSQALESSDWLFLRDTPKHPSILRNMQWATLRSFVKPPSRIFYATKKEG